ncbi:MAG: hypothetical protein CL605_12180, partial [Altibacter sp.]|nr:hypothetical protein [Altibacter sp.]
MQAPVLYLIFNRPLETKESFAVLQKVQPKKLYIAADGPRRTVAGEAAVCAEVRDYVRTHIDWDCEVRTLFREENLGCGKAVQGALDWFFETEEMGIILEDDIIPHSSFFSYASTLLHRYQYDTDIFSINGCNMGYENKEHPYGLTRYFNMWGWATWKRSNQLVHDTWQRVSLQEDFTHGSSLLNALKLDTRWPLE